MKFSVLVPVYNKEQYLNKCINSILNQTYKNFEIIIVDDGSIDSSGDICDEFKKNNPETITVVHQENTGLLAARRKAIIEAKGEFCIFVDSDDTIEPDLLETVYSYLLKENDIDIVLYSLSYIKKNKVCNRFKKIAKDGTIWEGAMKSDLYEKLLFSSDVSSLCTKAVRTKILKEDKTEYIKYYGKNMAEDLLQSIYVFTAAKKIIYADRCLYRYQILEDSISHSVDIRAIDKKNSIHVYELLKLYLDKWNLLNEENLERLNARWFNDAMYIMSMYYEKANNIIGKRAIIDYSWNDMIPFESKKEGNIYENSSYRKLYKLIQNKKYMSIELYFIKKRIYSLWKNRKKR